MPVIDFTEAWEELPRKREKRKNATTESIALLANRGGKGVVLEAHGKGIENEIDNAMSRYLDHIGLDNAPDGLSIWEGKLIVSSGSYEYPLETDAELVGEFRELTSEEWQRFRETGVPWEYEET